MLYKQIPSVRNRRRINPNCFLRNSALKCHKAEKKMDFSSHGVQILEFKTPLKIKQFTQHTNELNSEFSLLYNTIFSSHLNFP